jgi:hypothetical protein
VTEFEYTVKIRLQSEDSQSFDAVEKKVRDAALGGARELCGMIFQWFEGQWLANHKNFRHKGREEAIFKTTFGDVRFNRLRVVRNGKNLFPLDQWAGIESKDRCTNGLRANIVQESVGRSFRKSAQGVRHATSSSVSTMAAWRVTQHEGEKKKKKLTQAIPTQIPPSRILRFTEKPVLTDPKAINSKCPVLAVEIDATYCRNQLKSGIKHEVKLATLYTGKVATGKKKKRWALVNKTVLTQRAGETLQGFFGRLAWVARTVYCADEQTILIVRGDGDPWIRRFKDDHFPKAIHFLDHWHVKKKIRLAFGEFALEFMMPYVYARDPQGLLNHIQVTFLDCSQGLFPKQLIEMKAFYAYIQNNLDGLLPSGVPREIKEAHPGMFVRGSGVIERNIDLVIGERFKLKRMRWSRRGLDNLLALREHQINKANDSPLLKIMAS